jgi:hypothetical protein
MANSSIGLTSLDFDSYKSSLKTYLKQQDNFKDYDFEASNINVLLDVMSYNTYLNAFYMNMIGNEMFLDSAQLRDSVVSHAKELNYVPASFKSAEAKLFLKIQASSETKRNITIARGTIFSTRVGTNNFTFSTDENIVVTSANSLFTTTITVYEGDILSDTFTVNYANPTNYVISNKLVDISSLKVTVIENNGANLYSYTRATSLFDVNAASKVFFVQPYINDTYEIIFGDGIIGNKPKNNSVIILEYRICNGELPNGARLFRAAQLIDNESNITITTVAAATGGAVSESIESIKYNAPRAFTTQERAITSEDYENLLRLNYPEINAVAAYGGEDATPPQYGRIFVTVDLKDVDGLPVIKQNEYKRFLKSRSSVAMEPIFVNPDYTYLNVNTKIKYNINKTGMNPEDIRLLAMSSILSYAQNNLNNFNKTLRYSKLVKDIDSAEASIVSNETDVLLIKYLTPILNSSQIFSINFKTALIQNVPLLSDEHPIVDLHAITSSPFTYNGIPNCVLEDNGDGILRIVTPAGSNHKKIVNIGTVDYDTGVVNINNFIISSFIGTSLKIYATSRNKDISSSQNVILNILEPDVNIIIEQIRE